MVFYYLNNYLLKQLAERAKFEIQMFMNTLIVFYLQ